MDDVDDFVPTILHLLAQIEDKKAVFFDFPIPGAVAIIKQVLKDMYMHSTELSIALIDAAPVRNPFLYFCGLIMTVIIQADIKPHAMETKTVVDNAFKKLLNDFN